MTRRLRIALLALLALPLVSSPARAHVHLRRTEPGVGALLSSPPLELKFWFSEKVEIALTKVTLTDANGKVVGLAPPVVDTSDPLIVKVEVYGNIGKGTYKVAWQTLALDGHPAAGTFSFSVLGETESVDTSFIAAVNVVKRDSAAQAKRIADSEKPLDVLQARSANPVYVVMRALSFSTLLMIIGASAHSGSLRSRHAAR